MHTLGAASRNRTLYRNLFFSLIASTTALSTSGQINAQGPVLTKLTSWAKSHGKPPQTTDDKVLEQLAANVDWVEHHINQWGSVSSKAPDVWGEARLTQYRRELEEKLQYEATQFSKNQISGAQQVSDSAALAIALAFQGAVPSGGVPIPSITVNNASATPSVGATSSDGKPATTININGALPTPVNPFTIDTKEFLKQNIQLEQTQQIEQLVRYMQHVNQHRRTNEGDDTSDAPGYSLNLVRVPVSILPGSITKRGYGAEITYTAKPYLGPDLLPMTFRDMVLNDLTDQLSTPLVKFINSDPLGADMLWELAKRQGKSFKVEQFFNLMRERSYSFGSVPTNPMQHNMALDEGKSRQLLLEDAKRAVAQAFTSVCSISFSGNQSRRGQQPFPPTQIIDIYGLEEMTDLAVTALKGLREDVTNRRVIHLPDTQAFLREEINAAIELTYSECMREWWDRESTGERCLVNMIRNRNVNQIAAYRTEFLAAIPDDALTPVTRALAWCVFVESILLNERLNDDIRETAGTRPTNLQHMSWIPFFGPNPSSEARDQFAQYVQLRWPIRVFALDPQVDQQSIADASSVIRQMQLAVVLGFSSGKLGTSAALNTIRKLQRDRATIDLNRTAIAFGQGEDTFGWRFQPRFQTPPVEGNAKVFFRDLVSGGPTDKQLERGYEIEPGMRECTAIILMPSFVPYVVFETHGHWFKLAKPGHTGTSIQEDVQLSRAVKQMQNQAMTSVRCAHLYRDGEVDRVLARVNQLEKRLPLQTIACQVPIENTHGGFELFSNGTRQLSPEVTGWYGSPGYDPKAECTFFVTGDNFSLKQTHVVAGNRSIQAKLISRQILEITLPAGLPFMKDSRLLDHVNDRIPCDQEYQGHVDLQVASPYGVSAHLLIPVLKASKMEEAVTCDPTTLSTSGPETTLLLKRTNKGFTDMSVTQGVMLPEIKLPKGSELGVVNRKVRMYLTHGPNRLGPITFDNVPLSPTRSGFQIPADAFLKSVGDRGDMLEAAKSYADFLYNGGPLSVDFEAAYTVEYDRQEVPVAGSFIIKLATQGPPTN